MSTTTVIFRWPDPAEDAIASAAFGGKNDLAVVAVQTEAGGCRAIVPLTRELRLEHDDEPLLRLRFREQAGSPRPPSLGGARRYSWPSLEGRTLAVATADWLPVEVDVPRASTPQHRRAGARALAVDGGSERRPGEIQIETDRPLQAAFDGGVLVHTADGWHLSQ
jgi:hypothetical protein